MCTQSSPVSLTPSFNILFIFVFMKQQKKTTQKKHNLRQLTYIPFYFIWVLSLLFHVGSDMATCFLKHTHFAETMNINIIFNDAKVWQTFLCLPSPYINKSSFYVLFFFTMDTGMMMRMEGMSCSSSIRWKKTP